ncbi:MAG: hypothetical protein AAGA56_09180 [Myxococcota bacterium]
MLNRSFFVPSLVALALAACSDGGDDDGGSADSGSDTTAGMTTGGGAVDTSELSGTFAWFNPFDRKITVRQLASNTVLYENEPGPDEQLTNLATSGNRPQLSPDGGHLVYSRLRPEGPNDAPRPTIRVVDLSSGSETQLPNSFRGISPTVSSDGSRVAFRSEEVVLGEDGEVASSTGKSDIAIWNVGSEPVLLTDDDADDRFPYLSADGSTVIFVSNRDGSEYEFYSVPADGSAEPTALTSTHPTVVFRRSLEDCFFDVIDDASHVVFMAPIDSGNNGAFVLDVGLNTVATTDAEGVTAVSISGDGQRIAYANLLLGAGALSGGLFIALVNDPTNPFVIPNLPDRTYTGLEMNSNGSALSIHGGLAEELGPVVGLVLQPTDEMTAPVIMGSQADETFSLCAGPCAAFR